MHSFKLNTTVKKKIRKMTKKSIMADPPKTDADIERTAELAAYHGAGHLVIGACVGYGYSKELFKSIDIISDKRLSGSIRRKVNFQPDPNRITGETLPYLAFKRMVNYVAGDVAGNKATGSNISCESIYKLYIDNRMSIDAFGQTDAGMAIYNAKALIDAMSDKNSYGFTNALQMVQQVEPVVEKLVNDPDIWTAIYTIALKLGRVGKISSFEIIDPIIQKIGDKLSGNPVRKAIESCTPQLNDLSGCDEKMIADIAKFNDLAMVI
jgi:hypothetical protein